MPPFLPYFRYCRKLETLRGIPLPDPKSLATDIELCYNQGSGEGKQGVSDKSIDHWAMEAGPYRQFRTLSLLCQY